MMRRHFSSPRLGSIFLAASLLAVTGSPALAFEAYSKPSYAAASAAVALPPLALQAIQAASPVLKRMQPDWHNYQVQAVVRPDRMVVQFWKPCATATGPSGKVVVVEIDRATLKVLDSRTLQL